MIDLISLFTLLVAGFVLSKYFYSSKLSEEILYKDSKWFIINFFISFLSWIFIFWGYFLEISIIKNISLLVLLISLVIELCFGFIKINYYNNKFKLILKLKDNNINRDIIKRRMVKDSLKNFFCALASPLLIIEYLLKLLLNIIYK
jgi:hypothetical protein